MDGLPGKTLAQILVALPYTELATIVVRVCRDWQVLRASDQVRTTRAAVDERGLVVAGRYDEEGFSVRYCCFYCVIICDRWRERAPLPHAFVGSSTTFRGELVLLGRKQREGRSWPPCCLAFNLEANAWRSLAWVETDPFVFA